jgi:hypothetical protein
MKALMNFTFGCRRFCLERIGEECTIHSWFSMQFYISFHAENYRKKFWWIDDFGFRKVRKGESYLFISNHRDILLDTTLLNTALFEHVWLWRHQRLAIIWLKDFLNVLGKDESKFSSSKRLDAKRNVRKFKSIGIYWSFIEEKVDLFGLRNVKEGLRTVMMRRIWRIENGRNGL